MSDARKPELSRRKVFAATGAAGALAAAAAVPLARREAAPAPEHKQASTGGDGYQVTAHVLRYYETARI